jgi:hypothetical protein
MAFWEIDLTTRAGADTATYQGALASFIFSGQAVLGMVLFGGIAGYSTPEGITAIAGAGLELVIGLIAGFRLKAGKGAYWGLVAATFMVLEMIAKVIVFSPGGLLIGALILVYTVNGIRGAFALKKGVGFEDDDIEVFA